MRWWLRTTLILLAATVTVVALLEAVPAPAAAADVATLRAVKRTVVQRPPLALRTLSRHSALVLAATPCWRSCTTICASDFQGCLRIDRLDACMFHNNACELTCLKQCRLSGGPLVSWTDYWWQ